MHRRPAGDVAVISPWNFPARLSNRSVAPTLALGNAVVLKPAEDSPVTGGLWLAEVDDLPQRLEQGSAGSLPFALVGRPQQLDGLLGKFVFEGALNRRSRGGRQAQSFD